MAQPNLGQSDLAARAVHPIRINLPRHRDVARLPQHSIKPLEQPLYRPGRAELLPEQPDRAGIRNTVLEPQSQESCRSTRFLEPSNVQIAAGKAVSMNVAGYGGRSATLILCAISLRIAITSSLARTLRGYWIRTSASRRAGDRESSTTRSAISIASCCGSQEASSRAGAKPVRLVRCAPSPQAPCPVRQTVHRVRADPV